MTMDQDDYRVGYGKPPKATQFRTGKSGNPRGRPKTPTGPDSHLTRELNKQICVNEQGQRKRISKYEALMTRLVNSAISGDISATRLVYRHLERVQIRLDATAAAPAEEPANDDPRMMTDEQLMTIIARGLPDIESDNLLRGNSAGASPTDAALPSQTPVAGREGDESI